MKFVFQDGSILSINDKNFRDAVTKVMKEHLTFKNMPVKVLFPTTKKILYFDQNVFYAYLKQDIDQSELIEKTQCEGIFRNVSHFRTNDKEEIEAHSLWKKEGDFLYLVDDDLPVRSSYVEALFVEI